MNCEIRRCTFTTDWYTGQLFETNRLVFRMIAAAIPMAVQYRWLKSPR
nr:MAG TPA: hypothetical protein [Caudoviricetes sp.]